MGAIDAIKDLGAIPESELAGAIESLIDQARMCHGTDNYSGSLATKGVKGYEIVCDGPKEKEALIEHLEDRADKFGPILAARYFDIDGKERAKIESKYEKRCNALKAKIEAMPDQRALIKEVIRKIRNGKSKTRSCRHCESKVAVAFIDRPCCPVCGKSEILSKTDQERLERHKQKRDELRQKLQSLEAQMRQEIAQKAQDEGLARWLIVASCPS